MRRNYCELSLEGSDLFQLSRLSRSLSLGLSLTVHSKKECIFIHEHKHEHEHKHLMMPTLHFVLISFLLVFPFFFFFWGEFFHFLYYKVFDFVSISYLYIPTHICCLLNNTDAPTATIYNNIFFFVSIICLY